MIDGIESPITIRILRRTLLAEVETALGPENTTHLKLPRKLQQSVQLKRVVHRQIRRTFIEIRTIDEGVCLRDEASIRAHKETACVRPAGIRFGDERRDPDKTIGRQHVNSQLIISLFSERVIAAQRKTPRKAPRKTDHESIVSAFIPWTKRSYRSRSERR